MKLTRKLKTCLVLLLILSFTATATASPGKYIQLGKGQMMPWSGWCFDGEAMAQIVAEKELAEQKCELSTQQALEEQKARFDLQIGLLTTSMDYEVKTREDTIQALKKENLQLEDVIIHNNKFGWVGPSAIGFIVGGLTIFLVTL